MAIAAAAPNPLFHLTLNDKTQQRAVARRMHPLAGILFLLLLERLHRCVHGR